MKRTAVCSAFLLVVLFLAATNHVAAAAPGNVVVVRVGDGIATLSTVATPVFLDEYPPVPGATPVRTISLPTIFSGSNASLTVSGTSLSEGALRRSADGRYLTLAGYAAVPGTAGVTTSSSATTNRVVGRVDAAGTVDTSTRFNSAFNGGNIRGAVSNDGGSFWATGSISGVQYIPFGVTGPGNQLNSAPTNTRVSGIFGGQLYVTSGSSGYTGVSAVGIGLPTMAGQTATVLPGFPTSSGPSPYGFAMFDLNPLVAGLDTVYVTDDRSTSIGGGIQKWTFNGMTWTLSKTMTNGLTGCRGVTGYVSGANVVLFATTAEASGNKLVTVTDDGSVSPTFTTLATATANTVFRGVDLALAVTLTASTAGPGSGSVSGVDNPYPYACTATITAQPSANSYFTGWSGCSTSTQATIDVTMDGDKTCIASFALYRQLNITVTGSGDGTVTSIPQGTNPVGVACMKSSGSCLTMYTDLTPVELSQVPNVVSTFEKWDGDCIGTTTCNFTMDGTRNVTAKFLMAPLAKNNSTGIYYTVFSDALSAASTISREELLLIGTEYTGSVTLDKPVILNGGWLATYLAKSDHPTTLPDGLTVTAGGSAVESLVVKTKLTVRGGSLRAKYVTARR